MNDTKAGRQATRERLAAERADLDRRIARQDAAEERHAVAVRLRQLAAASAPWAGAADETADELDAAAEHLAHVAEAPLVRFVQLDGFESEPYADTGTLTEADEHGDALTGGASVEFVRAGVAVRVLVAEDAEPQRAARMLRKMAAWIERDYGAGSTMAEAWTAWRTGAAEAHA